ncbi:MAG: copper chaperone PCu(A)C [Acidimicrobiia bacterium]
MEKLKSRPVLFGLAFVMTMSALSCSETPGLEISDAWGRPSPSAATTGALFMTITNRGSEDDALIGAMSPACGAVELHESYMNDEGAMAMRPVVGGTIRVPAGGVAVLEQGGLHVMCIDKLEEFTEGAELQLTLQFEKAGDIPLTVEIREP